MSTENNMQLPKRNGLLTFFYAVLTVFMFLFFGYIITTGDVYVGLGYSAQLDEQYADYERESGADGYVAAATAAAIGEPTPKPVESPAMPTAAASPRSEAEPALPNDHLAAFWVAGLSRTVDVNAANEAELTALWNGIYEAGFPRRLQGAESRDTVYVVYSDYNHVAQTVRVTVGYRVAQAQQSAPATAVQVVAGRYEAVASHGADSVLNHWASNAHRQDLLFQTDFEKHRVDAWLTPQQSTMYLGKR